MPFRIPVARDGHQRLVPPEEAKKRAVYTCPACGGVVDLHAGAKKVRHFHHRAGACAPETVLHLGAKELVVRAVEAWREGGAPPVFARRCAHEGCEATTRQKMPSKIRRAVAEHRVASGHVVDVALLGAGDLVVAAIEVHVTHAVDEAKARELGVPWIEVEAADVCASMGRVLAPTRDRFLPWLCDEHAPMRGVAAREERHERATAASLARRLPYRIADFPGYRIDRVGACAKGHATLVFVWDGREPPWPRPPHVVARESESDQVFDVTEKKARRVLPFRRTYASVCVTCGGDIVG